MIMNLGNLEINKQSNGIIFDFAALLVLYQRFFYFFRICTIFLFPKIDILFECDNDVIKNIKKEFKQKIQIYFHF